MCQRKHSRTKTVSFADITSVKSLPYCPCAMASLSDSTHLLFVYSSPSLLARSFFLHFKLHYFRLPKAYIQSKPRLSFAKSTSSTMPEQVPFQTHTRRASQRSSAGQDPYPAAGSSSSLVNASSPPAAAPSSRTSAAPSQSAASSPAPNPPARRRAAPRQGPALAPGSTNRRTNATIESGNPRPDVASVSGSPVLDWDLPHEPSFRTTGHTGHTGNPEEVDLASFRSADPVRIPTTATHRAHPRPFLNPNLRARPSTRQVNDGIFLPAMPTETLEQIYPQLLQRRAPTRPSAGLRWLQQDDVHLPTEMDIADHNLDVLGNGFGPSYIFPELQGSHYDSQILFPELETNHFNFQHPSLWSFRYRRNADERCTSGVCPLRPAIHKEGFYLHGGRESPHPNSTFGRSNPPQHIWQAYIRMMESGESSDDLQLVRAFSYFHYSE